MHLKETQHEIAGPLEEHVSTGWCSAEQGASGCQEMSMGPTTNVLCQGPGGRTQELFGSEWVYTLQARVACMYRVTLIMVMVWAEMSFVD